MSEDISKQIIQYDIETKGEMPILDIASKFKVSPAVVCRLFKENGRSRVQRKEKVKVFGMSITEAGKISMQIDKPLLEKATKKAESKNIKVEELIREIIQKGLE